MFPTKILVADDDRVILSTVRAGLEAEGYQTLTASDGRSAVRIGCAKKPDLAILDIRMPGIYGIEAARQLRDRAGIPSIFLSAYADRELVELATKEGALGYLVKPIMIAQLIPTIEAALERSEEIKRLLLCSGLLRQRTPAGGERFAHHTRTIDYMGAELAGIVDKLPGDSVGIQRFGPV